MSPWPTDTTGCITSHFVSLDFDDERTLCYIRCWAYRKHRPTPCYIWCGAVNGLKLLFKVSISVSWSSRVRSGANTSPIVPWKNSAMLGSLSFSRLNLILMMPWFFTLWRRSLKVITTSSWLLPISAPGKVLVFAMFTLDWKRRLTMM